MALVDWGGFFQCIVQALSAVWHGHGIIEHDGLRGHFLAIEFLVGAVVGSKSRSRERDPSKKSAGARVRKNFGAQGDVGFCGGRAPHRASGGSCVATYNSLTLLERTLVAERVLISRSTKSVALPPNCKPALTPSRAIMVGALHEP